MADPQFDWWRAAKNGSFGPMQEANPQSGYYRHYIGTAVAIWRDGGNLIMWMNGEPVDDPIQRGKVWLQVARHPVDKKDYDARIATGEWPSALPEIPSAAQKTEVTEQAPAVAGPGDNSKDLDTYQRMRAEILGDVAEAEAFFAKNAIADKALADKATDWGDRLVKSAKQADDARLAENAPLRRQIEENDKKWQGIIGPARVRGAALRTNAEAWGKAEIARLQKEAAAEAQRKWEAEQAELRRQRDLAREAEQKRRAEELAKADADGVLPEPDPIPAPEPELPLAPPPPPVAPPPKLMLGSGTSGNRRSVKTAAPETASIVDLKAAAGFYASQNHPDLIALIQKLADRAIKARAEIPGIRFSWQTPKSEAAE